MAALTKIQQRQMKKVIELSRQVDNLASDIRIDRKFSSATATRMADLAGELRQLHQFMEKQNGPGT